NIAAVELRCDLDAVFRVLQRTSANRRIRIAERPEFINLVLKQVGIDGSGLNSVSCGKGCNLLRTGHAFWAIPQNMERDCRANACIPMHFAGIAELLFRGCGGGWLRELTEAGTGIGETPRRNFDPERL